MDIEQITMVCLLVGCCESAKNDHVICWDLEETTSFKADPVGVFLYLKIKSLPVIPFFEIKFLNQVGSLSTIESCNNVECLVLKCKCCVEVPSGIEIGYLVPLIGADIIHFTFIHAFWW